MDKQHLPDEAARSPVAPRSTTAAVAHLDLRFVALHGRAAGHSDEIRVLR